MNVVLTDRISQRHQKGNYRSLKISSAPIDFASNDYLGMARSPLLQQNLMLEWQTLGDNLLGSTGSRLLTGNNAYCTALEETIADFHGFETATLFQSGYLANLGLITALGRVEDVFLFDLHVHASTHDGLKLSNATSYPWRHNDLEHLETRLKNVKSHGNTYVCVESVYSTDGSLAPIKELTQLCHQYGALLIVDEAHAVGVFGPQGQGLTYELQLQKEVFAQVTTFGKAPGVHGAVILGSTLLQQTLVNFSRPFIYTTAAPAYCLAAIKCSYELFPKLERERQHLHTLIDALGLSSSSIQFFKVKEARALQACLEQEGFDVRALLSPTVPRGEEGVRICLHAYNTIDDVCHLKEMLHG